MSDEHIENLQIWERIYSDGRHLNLYPYDGVVSALFASYGVDLSGLSVLELGCGAGNNLWFAARHGASVLGVDFSATSIEFCKKRFSDEGLSGKFIIKNFEEIGDLNESFDFIIDRAALTTTNFVTIQNVYNQVFEKLKPNGVFYSQLYSSESVLNGEVSNGVYTNLNGLLEDCGHIGVFNQDQIDALINNFSVIRVTHTIEEDVYIENDFHKFAFWTCILRRSL